MGSYDWNRIATELNTAPQAKQQHARQPNLDQRSKGTRASNADSTAILMHIREALAQEHDDRT